MDALDQAEQRLKDELLTRPAGDVDGINSNPSGETVVTPLPSGPAPAPAAAAPSRAYISQQPGGAVMSGPDPLDQAEARMMTQRAMGTGEDLRPYLRHEQATGVQNAPTDQIEAAYRAMMRASDLAANYTSVGGSIGTQSAPVLLSRDEWERARRQWQIEHPAEPMPPELKVWQFGNQRLGPDGKAVDAFAFDQAPYNPDLEQNTHAEDGRGGALDQARDFHFQHNGRGDVPEVLRGTKADRDAAGRSASIESARARLGPAAASLNDDQVEAFDKKQQEAEGRDIVVRAVRKQLAAGGGAGDHQVSDLEATKLARENPDAFAPAIGQELLPKVIEEARANVEKRKLTGSLPGDSDLRIRFEKAMIAAADRAELGKRAGAQLAPGLPNLGDFLHFIDAADLGLVDLLSRGYGDDTHERYRAMKEGYGEQHRVSALVSTMLGYFTPGSPSYFLGKGLGALIGMPVRNAIAGVAGETTLSGALKAAQTVPAATAFARAPWLSRLGASSIASALELPFFSAAQAAVEGKGEQLVKAFNVGDPETRASMAVAMVLGPLLEEGPKGVLRSWKAYTIERQIAASMGQGWEAHLKDLGIEVTDKEALARVAKFEQGLADGKDFYKSASDAKVSLKDILAARDLGNRIKEAKAVKTAGASEAETPPAAPQAPRLAAEPATKGGGAATDQAAPPPSHKPAPTETELARLTPYQRAWYDVAGNMNGESRDVFDQVSRLEDPDHRDPIEPGKELLGPRDAMKMRTRHLLDIYAPRGPDGKRNFNLFAGGDADVAKTGAALRVINSKLAGETITPEQAHLPFIQELQKFRRLSAEVDRLEGLYAPDKIKTPQEKQTAPTSYEDRRLPDVSEKELAAAPEWKPKLSSMTAAKSRAVAAGIPKEKLGPTIQVPTSHVLDRGTPNADGVHQNKRRLQPGDNSQADAVPPLVVRKTRNGGYEVLHGREQLAAAKELGFKKVPVIVAEGAAPPADVTEESRARGRQTSQPHPEVLDGPKAVGEWYAKTFNDTAANGAAIEALASMQDGRYVLADVDSSTVDVGAQAGDKHDDKVKAIANLPEEKRRTLPPAILVGKPDQRTVADGAHRTLAAQALGAPIRAYVPESWLGTRGVKRVQSQANAAAEAKSSAVPDTDTKPRDDLDADRRAMLGSAEDLAAWRRQLKKGQGGTYKEKLVDQLAARIQKDLATFAEKHGDDAAEKLLEEMQAIEAEEPEAPGESEEVSLSADPKAWDFESVYPPPVLDPKDPNGADALARQQLEWRDDGTFDPAEIAAVWQEVGNELTTYADSAKGAHERLQKGTTDKGKPLTEQQRKGLRAHVAEMRRSIEGQEANLVTVFGEAATKALHDYLQLDTILPPQDTSAGQKGGSDGEGQQGAGEGDDEATVRGDEESHGGQEGEQEGGREGLLTDDQPGAGGGQAAGAPAPTDAKYLDVSESPTEATKRAGKLQELADAMEEKIQEKLRGGGIGQQRPTPRRTRIAEAMRREGEQLRRRQNVLKALAQQWREGRVLKSLFFVRNRAQVDRLLLNHDTSDHPESKADATRLADGGPAPDDTAIKIKTALRGLVGKKIPGFFPTPDEVADQVAGMAAIEPHHTVLEPSAGYGALVDAVKRAAPGAQVVAVEANHELREILKLKGIAVHDVRDFTQLPADAKFDRIVMNPPFEKGADADHVTKAFEQHLSPGGVLVAIVSEGLFFREDKKAQAFRELVEDNANPSEIYKLPSGTFTGKLTGHATGVATRIVKLSKRVKKAASIDLGDKLWTKAPHQMKDLGYAARRSGAQWRILNLDGDEVFRVGTEGGVTVGSEDKAFERFRVHVEQLAIDAGLYKPPTKLTLPPGAVGNDATIQTANDPIPARYAVVDVSELQPSHDPWDFKPNPLYPANVQERDYQHDKEEQAKVQRNWTEFNPAWVLTDNPDPTNGPPMVLKSGLTMGGNSRVMVLQRVLNHSRGTEPVGEPAGKSYVAQLREKLEAFGIDPAAVEGIKKPVLVRVIEEETTDPAKMRELVRATQKGRTQEMSGAMDAASRARILFDNPTSLERLEGILGDDDSVREVLEKPSKTASIRDWLVGSGAMTRQEAARYIHNDTGMFNADGKALIERILQAVVVPDVQIFDNLPAQTANKITGNLYGLVLAKTKGGDWDFTAALNRALLAFFRWRASGAPLESWLKGEAADGQKLMVRDSIVGDPHGQELLKRLAGDTTVVWRARVKAFTSFARDADVRQGEIFPGARATASDAFRAAFLLESPTGADGTPTIPEKKSGGGLFAGGPEAYYHQLDRLKELLSWPENMSPTLRGIMGLPRRLRDGDRVFMVTGGAEGPKVVDVAKLLGDPETAEHLIRIATFHLEQNADAGEKLMARWADGVTTDLKGILRDLGYSTDGEKYVDLLERLWNDLTSDQDVRAALGDSLPSFDRRRAGGAARRSQGPSGGGASRGGRGPGGGAGGTDAGAGPGGGSDVPPGGDLGGPGDELVPGEGPGPVSGEPEPGDGVPRWVPAEQRQDYLAALDSDRVVPYAPLAPQRRGHHHPRILVESKALAGVKAGEIADYEPDPRAVVDVSDPQRDQARAIGNRIHNYGAGALVSDDVGVGKSRIIGATVADQLYRALAGLSGKSRIVILTKNPQNVADLVATFTKEMKGTFRPLQEAGLQIHALDDVSPDVVRNWGSAPDLKKVLIGHAYNVTKYTGGETLKRFGADLVIVDEAHLYSNLAGEAQRANALEQLHADLMPAGAHFVYFTATPASDISALQFMYGLGLWSPKAAVEADKSGTLRAFDKWLQDATGVTKAGSWRESIATPIIEQLMRELKMDNAYHALDFWRGGFTFEMREAKVTPEDVAAYDAAAGILLDGINTYKSFRAGLTGAKSWPKPTEANFARADAGEPIPATDMSAPLRPDGQAIFFVKRLLVEFRMEAAIAAAKEALARGEQVVFKVLGVTDTALTGDGGNLGAVFDSIPQFTPKRNGKGQVIGWRVNGEALSVVQALRDRAKKLSGTYKVRSPLKRILEEFGDANVAAIVGATTPRARVEQNAEFQSGKRKVAVISPAGTTGINLQDLGTGKRFMVALDLDWDSKEFKQSLGRVDRANQVTSPGAVTIYTPIAGERKFQATIAARMKALGAIAKGQTDAGAAEDALNDFDMESGTWSRAINEVVRALPRDQRAKLLHSEKIDGGDELSWRDFQNDLMLLPVVMGNRIYEQAYARWQELEALDAASRGGKVARRNRGLIRETTALDETTSTPLEIHRVEAVTGETYGILAGKLLTRPPESVSLKTIQDLAFGRGSSQLERNHYVTMQQGDRVITGLFIPRGKIERVKALFKKGPPGDLAAGGGPVTLPPEILDELPPALAAALTPPALPQTTLAKKHQFKRGLVSRQDLTNAVIRRLRMAVGVGKDNLFRRRSALGFYRPGMRIIRMQTANSIGTLAHEVGHAIDDILTQLNPPTQFDGELLALGARTSRGSYTKLMRRREGVAEFFRLWFTDRQAAYAAAPGYAKWVETELLKHPDLWQAMNDLAAGYTQYLSQDPVEQFESQIAFEDGGPTIRSPLADEPTGQSLYRHVVDTLAPLDWMRKGIKKEDTPLAAELSRDPYALARLNAGNRTMVLGWVKYGVRLPTGRRLADGLIPTLEKNGIRGGRRMKEFEMYLVARRALYLYDQEAAGERKLKWQQDAYGGALGVTRKQAEAVLAKFDSPAFRAAADGVKAWNRAVFSYLGTTGFFDPTQLAEIQRMNEEYAPLHRVIDHIEASTSGGRGLVDKGRAFFRVFGSGRRIKRPLETLIKNTVRIVDMTEANKAAMRAYDMLRAGKDGGLWADPVARPIAGHTGSLAEIKKSLVAAGVDPMDFEPHPVTGKPKVDLDTLFTIFRPIRHNPADMEVAIRWAGKVKVWQVHSPALYDALTGGTWSPPTNNLLLRILAMSKTIASRGFTLPLEFVFSNLQRDQFTAFTQSRYGYVPGVDFLKGLWHTLAEDETYQLWLQARGGSSAKVSSYSDELQKTIDRMNAGKAATVAKDVMLPWRGVVDLFEAISQSVEEATRVGEFAKALKAEGVSAEGLARAGLASRDVTVDFMRGGEWSRQIGQWRAFFGANVQGKDYLARHMLGRGGTAKDRRRAFLSFMLRAIAGVTMTSLVLHYLSRDNPDYQERKGERLLYWLIPIGNPKTTRKWFRIRKPHELGALFGTAGENLLEAWMKKDPKSLREVLPDQGTAVGILMELIPTVLEPAFEAYVNYDTFRGRAIVPPELKDLEPELQYNRFTSDTAKAIGHAVNVSPLMIDHLIYGYGGTFGREFVVKTLTDPLVRTVRPSNAPPLPDRGDVDQDLPGVRIFFSRDLSPSGADSVAEFYRQADRLRVVKRSMQQYAGETLARYRNENRAVLVKETQIENAEKGMKLLRDQAKLVYDDPSLSPAAKRARLQAIGDRMVNVARGVLGRPALTAATQPSPN